MYFIGLDWTTKNPQTFSECGFLDFLGLLWLFKWCLERESNSHAHGEHEILSLGCLPVPPSRLRGSVVTRRIAAGMANGVCKERRLPLNRCVRPEGESHNKRDNLSAEAVLLFSKFGGFFQVGIAAGL